MWSLVGMLSRDAARAQTVRARHRARLLPLVGLDEVGLEGLAADRARDRGEFLFGPWTAPNGREVACERRPRTNTPLQALATLNDRVFVECSAALARRIVTEVKKDDRERLTYAFRLCVARAPTPAELELLLQLRSLGEAVTVLWPEGQRYRVQVRFTDAAGYSLKDGELVWKVR